MSYELTYEDGKWYVWSTVVDDYVSGPLKSPNEVAEFVVEVGKERGNPTEEKVKEIYREWYREAVKVQRNPEEGAQIVATFRMTPEGDPEGLVKYPEPIRMTPKLKDLNRRFNE